MPSEPTIQEIRSIVFSVVPHAEIYLYGSRVKGTARPHSDIDIIIKSLNMLTLKEQTLLQEAFENSDIPFIIDFHDYYRLDPDFLTTIDPSLVPIV